MDMIYPRRLVLVQVVVLLVAAEFVEGDHLVLDVAEVAQLELFVVELVHRGLHVVEFVHKKR